MDADGGRRDEDGARYPVSDVRFDVDRPDAALFAPPPGATIER